MHLGWIQHTGQLLSALEMQVLLMKPPWVRKNDNTAPMPKGYAVTPLS